MSELPLKLFFIGLVDGEICSIAKMPAIRGSESKKKTRRRRRDLDQIHSDLHVAGHLNQYKREKAEEDLPGLGQYYCTECAKWFDHEDNLTKHVKSKVHKKRFVRKGGFGSLLV